VEFPTTSVINKLSDVTPPILIAATYIVLPHLGAAYTSLLHDIGFEFPLFGELHTSLTVGINLVAKSTSITYVVRVLS
jgi:hypothetical protein